MASTATQVSESVDKLKDKLDKARNDPDNAPKILREVARGATMAAEKVEASR